MVSEWANFIILLCRVGYNSALGLLWSSSAEPAVTEVTERSWSDGLKQLSITFAAWHCCSLPQKGSLGRSESSSTAFLIRLKHSTLYHAGGHKGLISRRCPGHLIVNKFPGRANKGPPRKKYISGAETVPSRNSWRRPPRLGVCFGRGVWEESSSMGESCAMLWQHPRETHVHSQIHVYIITNTCICPHVNFDAPQSSSHWHKVTWGNMTRENFLQKCLLPPPWDQGKALGDAALPEKLVCKEAQ